ncbi:glutathione-s-transferase theta, gst [Culex quinquefasciatus]|uniref:glutathione transferase n=1 Tax=Culex quinquefasciatus TaxID=7176 RepID=B0X3C7_CULQU|nr:glutathione-s-transferase theta, gst [Culex quinquefasciatus]|eukprot:XP_001864149.1 glutathione-s-transferase theta, gst [Culex quinquefasciatus]
MSTELRYYYDLMSQPCRALYIFLEMTKIPYRRCPIDLRKGEHLTDEFRAINRFPKVPCIVADGDFHLAESVAIIQFLAREYPEIPDHWYPRNSRTRARIDEYMAWQQHNTRSLCAAYFMYVWLRPRMLGTTVRPERAEQIKDEMERCLDFIEREYLGRGSKFIVGDEISVADLLAACEIEQPRMAGYDPCAGRPNLTAWMGRVREVTSPFYEQAHVVVNKIAAATNAALNKL